MQLLGVNPTNHISWCETRLYFVNISFHISPSYHFLPFPSKSHLEYAQLPNFLLVTFAKQSNSKETGKRRKTNASVRLDFCQTVKLFSIICVFVNMHMCLCICIYVSKGRSQKKLGKVFPNVWNSSNQSRVLWDLGTWKVKLG